MAVFVINEWLWADSSGQNGAQAQGKAFSFIVSLARSNHQIVVIEGSAFDQKAWNLCRNDSSMIAQRIGAAYVMSIRQNSDLCLILKPEAVVPLPEELDSAVKPDDRYLLQAVLSVAGSILVSTDEPLRKLAGKADLQCLSRDEFLNTYFRMAEAP